eukprot:1530839-Prymnesium_polylepis.1
MVVMVHRTANCLGHDHNRASKSATWRQINSRSLRRVCWDLPPPSPPPDPAIPGQPPPPSPSPTPPPPNPSPLPVTCRGINADTCVVNLVSKTNDGICDDGGTGSVTSICIYGTDYTDCGARDCIRRLEETDGGYAYDSAA